MLKLIHYEFIRHALKSEDYALLLGSIFVFMIIAILMLFTHKVDWNKIGKSKEETKE